MIKKIILIIIGIIVLVAFFILALGSVSDQYPPYIINNNVDKIYQPSSDALSYTKNNQLFTLSKNEFSINSDNYEHGFSSCDNSSQYNENLMSKYTIQDKGVEYKFKYVGGTEVDPYIGTYIVRVLPNKLGYSDITRFKKDFALCESAFFNSPVLISDKYLVFQQSCGTGGGGQAESDCWKVKEFVKPTLQLK